MRVVEKRVRDSARKRGLGQEYVHVHSFSHNSLVLDLQTEFYMLAVQQKYFPVLQ